MIKPVGVTVLANTNSMTRGETTAPSKYPSFIHKRFSTRSDRGKTNPKNKNATATPNGQRTVFSRTRKKYVPIAAKTTANTTPKLRSEDSSISYREPCSSADKVGFPFELLSALPDSSSFG